MNGMPSKARIVVATSSLTLSVLFCAFWYLHRAPRAQAEVTYRQIRWPDLVPADWDQFKRMRELKIDGLRDADPRAQRLLADMRTAWDAAPTVDALDGKPVQVSGYVVPLEGDSHGLTEILLVPYEGACIHTPPPPANQIIHVTLSAPMKGLRLMDNVVVQGVISASRESTFRGVSGYALAEASAKLR